MGFIERHEPVLDERARAPFAESADIACDHNGFPHMSDSGSAAVTTPMIVNEGQLMVTTVTGYTQLYDSMTLSIRDKLAGAATSVATYQRDDYNHASCVNCLIIRADCEVGCFKTFIAGRGNLRVTNVEYAHDSFVPDVLFDATLSNVALIEVEIDPNTLKTEIVNKNETWCINQFSISGTV